MDIKLVNLKEITNIEQTGKYMKQQEKEIN
jgi:hypothetical protein